MVTKYICGMIMKNCFSLGVCNLPVRNILKFIASQVLKSHHKDLKLQALTLLRLLWLALWILLSVYTPMTESLIGEGEADVNMLFWSFISTYSLVKQLETNL